MSCKKSKMPLHGLIQDIDKIDCPKWAKHRKECQPCNKEHEAYTHSLEVFKQLGNEFCNRHKVDLPPWESLQCRLDIKTCFAPRWNALAGGLGLALLTLTLVFWPKPQEIQVVQKPLEQKGQQEIASKPPTPVQAPSRSQFPLQETQRESFSPIPSPVQPVASQPVFYRF